MEEKEKQFTKDLEKLNLSYKLKQVYTPYKLKKVDRRGTVNERQESTAEHVYSSIFLAKYLIKLIKQPLDENKVISLLLYHDLTEIVLGDLFILDEERRKLKEEHEIEATEILNETLPDVISTEVKDLMIEYINQSSIEAKFAKAVERLDPMIHSINIDEWKSNGFTEEIIRDIKEPCLKEFPELKEFFEEIMDNLKNQKLI